MALDLGDLEYRVRVDTSDLGRAERSMGEYTRSSSSAESSVDRFGRSSERAGRRARSGMRQASSSADRASSAFGSLQGVVAALGGVLAVGQITRYSDAWNNAANQIRQVTDSASELASMQERLLGVANETRSAYGSTANLYSRLARSTTEMALSSEDLLGITRTINQSFAVSGATADEAGAAITQLSQGLAAGALRGEEFNSVSEQAPAIMRSIAASLNMGIGELRDFAAEGGITSEIVVKALEEASDSIANKFGKSVATFGQQTAVANNNLAAFAGESSVLQDSVSTLGSAMVGLTEILRESGNLVNGLVGSIGAATSAYVAYRAAAWTATAAQTAFNVAVRANPLTLAATAAVALAGALWSLRDVTVTIGDETATVGEVISATWQEVTQGLLTAWEEITGPINNLIDSIGEQFGNTSGESVDVWGAAMDGIVFGAKTAVNTLIGVFVGLADSIAQIINNIAWNFETLWTGVADAAQSAFSGDFSGAAEALNRELISPLENVGRRFSEGLFRDYVGELGTAVSETISAGQTFKTLDQWLMEVGSTSAQTSESMGGTTSATTKAGKAAEEAAKAAAKFDKSLNSLLDTLFPAQAAARQYQQQQILLQTALMSGRIEADKYFDALKRLEEAQLSQQAPGQAYGGMGFGSQIGSRQQGMGGEQEQDPLQQWLESARTAFSDFDQMQANVAQNFQTQFGNAFEKVIFDSDSLGEAFANLANSMMKSIVNAIGQMIAQWIAFKAVTGLLGGVGGAYGASAGGGVYTGGAPGGLYDDGGYTGDGGRLDPAGIVHRGEFVVQKSVVDNPGVRNHLERLNSGYADGGYVGGGRSSSSAPDSSGGAGDIIIQVSPQVQPGATERDGERYGRGVGNEIKSIVRQVIANEMAPRGMLRNVKGP